MWRYFRCFAIFLNDNEHFGGKVKLSEREEFIINTLKTVRYASVKYLSNVTYTSPSSIRRDLTRLENAGIVKRSYGGVTLVDGDEIAPPIFMRKDKNRSQKLAIARKASALIKDGMTIILDGSTTAFYLLNHIVERKNVTVITNSLLTASTAIEYGIKVYSTGGYSENGSPVLIGAYAEETFQKLTADICFISSSSLSNDGDVTDINEQENKLRKIIMERVKVKVLLLDNSKKGKLATHVLCKLSDFDYYFNED